MFTLTADDTQKLSQQENEIRQYANDLYKLKKINQQQGEKITKQANAFQNLSRINDELCVKISELAHLQNADTRLTETAQQHAVLAGKYETLQSEHSILNNDFNELKQLIDTLENERNEVLKENKELAEKMDVMSNQFEMKSKLVEQHTDIEDQIR